MTSPILALRAAIIGCCRADAVLRGLMGGAVGFFDEPPAGAEPVYAVFGPVEARDASVDGCPGHEQDVAIDVWGKRGSARSALEAAERIAGLLHDGTGLAVAGHRLANLRVTRIDARRDDKSNLAVVAVRLRAVTEVA